MTTPSDSERTASFEVQAEPDPGLCWFVVVAHHVDPRHVGTTVAVERDAPLVVGRGLASLGQDVLADEHLSRQHARIELDARGRLQVRDCESRNGTFLNGARTAMGRVNPGDVIGVGRMLLVAEACVADPHVAPHDEAPHDQMRQDSSRAWSRCETAVDRAATRDTAVLLWGPSGSGKDHLARRIHAASGSTGEFVVLRCGSFGDNAATVLMGDDGGRLLESARDGTLYLDGIDDAPDALQAALLELLEHGRVRRADSGQTVPLALRVVASARTDPRGSPGIRQDFLHRVARWVVPVPPLAKRRSDVARLMQTFAERYAGPDARIHPELAFRLLRHAWPGNVRELEAVIERAVVERRDNAVVGEFPELDDILVDAHAPAAISTMSRAPRPRHAWTVAVSGRWFATPQGERHDLERRKILARLLEALVTARRDRPGERLTVVDLLAAAWPDDRFVGTAGANRVYVALATLRKLGLRDIVVRTDGGYVIDPDARVQIVDG